MTPPTTQIPASLVLITTTDVLACRRDELDRLLRSVDEFTIDRRDVTVEHVLLLQRSLDKTPPTALFSWLHVLAIAELVPLSRARNIVLADLIHRGRIGNDTVVAFPDDDAWYPLETLHAFTDKFQSQPQLDLLVCRYDPCPRGDAKSSPAGTATLQQAISHGSSNTIFVRGSLLIKIGSFDEGLGLGTPAGAGEDTDFAIRAHLAARVSCFIDAPLVGHRANVPGIRHRYYTGSATAIRKHATRSPMATVAFARKLAVGLVYVLQRKLSLTELAGACWSRQLALRTSEGPKE